MTALVPGELSAYVEHFRARVLQDALNEATSSYWLRRAKQFEDARPRIGDFHGEAPRDDLRGRFDELTEIATACRNAAKMAILQTEITTEVLDALAEVA